MLIVKKLLKIDHLQLHLLLIVNAPQHVSFSVLFVLGGTPNDFYVC